MNLGTRGGAGGAVTTAAMFEYLRPEINRPDLFERAAYSIPNPTGGNPKGLSKTTVPTVTTNRSSLVSIFYTFGLIIISAAIFVTIAAWSNTLLSWLDSIYVSSLIAAATKARLYFALLMTLISLVVIITLLLIWYYYVNEREL